MNNFTYENTKDATHYGFVTSTNAYFYIDMGSRYQYTSKIGIVNTSPKPWLASEVIDLSRPHNETAAYWTNEDGDIKYAQPQGNEMDIKTLVPIDFSRNITPSVGGDKIWNNYLGVVITLTDGSASLLGADGDNPGLYVISFADRPNTGKQPVGDDVVVDTIWGGVVSDDTSLANTWDWGQRAAIQTWKPSIAAMLKQWQAEQLENVASDRLANLNEDNLISHADMVAKFDTAVSHEGAIKYMNSKIKEINDKPTFTQSMADAGEKAPIGSDVIAVWKNAECIITVVAHNDNNQTVGTDDRGDFLINYTNDVDEFIKPIQTAEQKLRDAIMEVLSCTETGPDVDNLLASDKFTITLKG